MAWFECTTGASSGNGVALIVTTDAEFAGTNITASNGEDTFTQQCPSSAPYVVTFEDIPTGTYTISAVSGGQTVTNTYVVSDYNFEFHNIPTGSTATPVNVIQTWLHCANIWNKNYTTINQVLADTSTLLALISSNNAADYMARSTNWASSVCANQTAMGYIGNNNYCANKLLSNSTWCNAICNSSYFENVLNVKIPVMTSATTPSGTVTGYQTSGGAPYKWFDGVTDDITQAVGVTPNTGYVGYDFGKQVVINKMGGIYKGAVLNYNCNFILKGSNDNSNYTTIGSMPFNINISEWQKVNFNSNNTKYRYYRITADGNNYYAGGAYLNEIQLYGRVRG